MIEQDIYNLTRESFVLLAFHMHRVLRPYQLTIEQYDTLLHLETENGCRLGELRQKVLIDHSKMTRIADYLAQQGWAERRPDPDDRRAQRLVITDAGQQVRDAAQAAHADALQQWLTAVPANEKTTLAELLTRLRDTLHQSFINV